MNEKNSKENSKFTAFFLPLSGTLFSVPLKVEAREELVNVARDENVKITVNNRKRIGVRRG